MRRLRLLVACALIALNAADDDDTWSWGKQRTEAGDQLSTAQVVDNILQSGRSGKSLEGYDEVYADPDVQQAISGGNETQARHFIQERLCGLGLMTCELDAEGRYIQPHEVIYAQPVAIKPVGRPLPAIPLKGSLASSLGGVGYGPPRPVPLPPRPGYGPPSPYPSRPYKSGPYSPDEFPPPPPFKHSVDESKPVVVVSGQQQGLQTHVHHHFHHGDGGGKVPVPGVIDTFEPAPYPSAPAGSYGTPSYSPGPLYGNSIGPSGAGGLYSKPEFYKKQLNLKGPTYPGNGINGASSIYSPGSSYSPSSSYSPGSSYSPSSSFNPSTSYNPGSSYNPSSNYKPNYNPPTNNFNTGASTNYNRYPNYESPRLDADCYCVPFDQCLPHEIARKQDGYFIDPRTNGGSTIEALGPDEVVITDGNGTMTVVTKPKREDTEAKKEVEEKKVELTEKKTQEKKDRKRREAEDSVAEAAETEERKHKPREVGEIKDEASARYEVTESDDDNSLKQGRKFGLGGGGGGGDDDDSDSDSGGNGLKLRPTFGVSFGLPSGGGGYPVNPYGPNPAINPYYGSVGGNGLDLGLVSVNPLLSVQVTRDEYGEKVVKPLVNLHVTPNHGLVHKVGQVIHKFKEPHYGGYGGGYGGYYGGPPPFYHTHKHQHFHAPPPPHIYHHKPTVYPYKPYGPPSPPSPYYEPSYAPSFNSFRTDVGPNGYDDFNGPAYASSFTDPSSSYSPGHDDGYASNYDGPDSYDSNYYRSSNTSFQNGPNSSSKEAKSNLVQFPSDRRQKRETGHKENEVVQPEKRQAYYPGADKCGPQQVCCRRPLTPPPAPGGHLYRPQCGVRNTQGVNGRIKNPVYVDGDSEFGEYPWQVAILKKDPQESVYICGGTLIDAQHVITAAHCVKSYTNYDLRVRLGEWDVNHDVEFYPYVERDVSLLQIHPEFYAGTLFNDLAILRLDQPADLRQNPHISPACLPEPHADYSGARCYTTGWGKDAFGDYGKYQNILKEVDVPVVSHHQCEAQLQQTRLGYDFKLHPGFVCAGGEEGKDACKGDGGGPMVCERGGSWQVVGVVSWGIGCGQYGVPGVYVKVAHYLDWIRQIVNRY